MEKEVGALKFEARFTSEETIKNFVRDATKEDYDIDITDGRYTIDGKSIVGIYSIELNKKITITLHTEDENELRKFVGRYGEVKE